MAPELTSICSCRLGPFLNLFGDHLVVNGCELFFPLQSPGSPRGGNPRKMGKNYKIPLPGPTPENGEKLPKNYKKYSENTFFCNFSVIFPHFRGLDRGGEFCNFSPFFGDFRLRGFRGSVRGKTNRKSMVIFWTIFCRRLKFIQYRTGVWKCHRSLSPDHSPSTG